MTAFFPFMPATISSNGEPQRYWGSLVTANYFDVVRPAFALGRGFDAARDDRPGAAPVVVLSHGLWRSRFAGELQDQVRAFGESDPENSSSVAGSIHRAWINLKAAVTSEDDHAILAECERGEDSAVSEYKKAMAVDLSSPLRETVSRQYDKVKIAHDRVRTLRDSRKK